MHVVSLHIEPGHVGPILTDLRNLSARLKRFASAHHARIKSNDPAAKIIKLPR